MFLVGKNFNIYGGFMKMKIFKKILSLVFITCCFSNIQSLAAQQAPQQRRLNRFMKIARRLGRSQTYRRIKNNFINRNFPDGTLTLKALRRITENNRHAIIAGGIAGLVTGGGLAASVAFLPESAPAVFPYLAGATTTASTVVGGTTAAVTEFINDVTSVLDAPPTPEQNDEGALPGSGPDNGDNPGPHYDPNSGPSAPAAAAASHAVSIQVAPPSGAAMGQLEEQPVIEAPSSAMIQVAPVAATIPVNPTGMITLTSELIKMLSPIQPQLQQHANQGGTIQISRSRFLELLASLEEHNHRALIHQNS
jgi:hypothetical protein